MHARQVLLPLSHTAPISIASLPFLCQSFWGSPLTPFTALFKQLLRFTYFMVLSVLLAYMYAHLVHVWSLRRLEGGGGGGTERMWLPV